MLNQKEIGHFENILRAIKKAKYDDMLGLEVLALAQAFSFLSDFVKKEKEELQKPKIIDEPIKLSAPKAKKK